MSSTIALPWRAHVRKRRRKRRPMTRRERVAFAWLGFDVCYGALCIGLAFVLAGKLPWPWAVVEPMDLLSGIWLCWLGKRLWWPTARNYLRNGWEDE